MKNKLYQEHNLITKIIWLYKKDDIPTSDMSNVCGVLSEIYEKNAYEIDYQIIDRDNSKAFDSEYMKIHPFDLLYNVI